VRADCVRHVPNADCAGELITDQFACAHHRWGRMLSRLFFMAAHCYQDFPDQAVER
jgi:hypothetical protein